MTDYDHKYSKYKSKYKRLKNHLDEYKFHYFDIDEKFDAYKQNEYIYWNIGRLIALQLNCFPLNNNHIRKKNEIDYILALNDLIQKNVDKQFYFLLSKDKEIICYCWLGTDYAISLTEKEISQMETYTLLDKWDDPLFEKDRQKLTPTIMSLCRDSEYKGVGKILIDNICAHLKTKNKNILYLIPESGKFKDNYQALTCSWYKCGLMDPEIIVDNKSVNMWDLYKKSNMELIDYYKKIGFELSPNLYALEMCGCDMWYQDHIFFNLMTKAIDIKTNF
ncbi:MAG: hypothetical protein Harvfovirus27_18 [Harvfovirus sp.]|uniref:Uncharacterized protein n=1 Tax=Harvfovirus sp. TaxID=2487768 RepID=A0A3G5A796_9VIRU|nr:MAG: hypothetical protein Harvfovirus27_18 [Harvfovirus sp.]